MVSSLLHGAQRQGGRHGRLWTGNRTTDETAVRVAGRKGSATVCRHRGDEVGSWRHRVHRGRAEVRSQDYSPGTTGTGRDARAGRQSDPKKRGGRKRLIDVCPNLEENFLKVLQDHTAGDP